MGIVNVLVNVTKAAVATIATPVALVADVLTLPASSMDPYRGPFDRTSAQLRRVGECMDAATKPERDEQ
jgi:hypothetical protein